jgi:Ferritin-like domain
MTDVNPAVSRGQFIKNTTKGSLVLVGSGGLLASMDGVAFAKSATKSDIATLQVAYIAESLAVVVYSAIIKNFSSFKGLQNKDYFVAALKNEKDHKALLASALGAKKPSGFKLHIPKAAVKSTKALTSTGVALESAFVETYLGAVNTLSSTELKLTAAKVAANEASHFSFFGAANGGHGVLPSLPGTITAKTAAATLTKDGFIS